MKYIKMILSKKISKNNYDLTFSVNGNSNENSHVMKMSVDEFGSSIDRIDPNSYLNLKTKIFIFLT